MEELREAVAAYSAGKSIFETFRHIRGIAGAGVISAYFNWKGERIEGDSSVEVEVHPQRGKESVWWYSVKPVQDYVFDRMAVIQSGYDELLGTVVDDEDPEVGKNPDSRYWRWVARPMTGVIVGGTATNAKIDFVVVGYKPKALLRYFSQTA